MYIIIHSNIPFYNWIRAETVRINTHHITRSRTFTECCEASCCALIHSVPVSSRDSQQPQGGGYHRCLHVKNKEAEAAETTWRNFPKDTQLGSVRTRFWAQCPSRTASVAAKSTEQMSDGIQAGIHMWLFGSIAEYCLFPWFLNS